MDLHADEFLTLANNALSRGLEKSSFITVSVFLIDKKNRTLEVSRAGHCPSLYFSKKSGNVEYLLGEGIGLGILRNHEFRSHVNILRIEFEAGDLLFMFTDGIVEAKNRNREEFGYERLKEIIVRNAGHSPEYLRDAIIQELFRFCDAGNPEDDYTMVILKFK
jgi:serine phosphatase RsbU (regulator of sigma subunit)